MRQGVRRPEGKNEQVVSIAKGIVIRSSFRHRSCSLFGRAVSFVMPIAARYGDPCVVGSVEVCW
jgi:hypothetical protein